MFPCRPSRAGWLASFPESMRLWAIRLFFGFSLLSIAAILLHLAIDRPVTTEERRQAKQEWLESARLVAEQARDSEALLIYHFLAANIVLAAPDKSPLGLGKKCMVAKVLEATQSADWIVLVPLFPEDRSVSIGWTDFLDGSGFASFNLSASGILVRAYHRREISPLWQGVVFLHEGSHAFRFIVHGRYQQRNEVSHYLEEQLAYTLQNRLLMQLGGWRYMQLLNQEAARIKVEIQKQGGRRQVWIPQRDDYPGLTELFGPPLSRDELKVRRTGFFVHANFALIASDPTVLDKQAAVMEFLRDFYRDESFVWRKTS